MAKFSNGPSLACWSIDLVSFAASKNEKQITARLAAIRSAGKTLLSDILWPAESGDWNDACSFDNYTQFLSSVFLPVYCHARRTEDIFHLEVQLRDSYCHDLLIYLSRHNNNKTFAAVLGVPCTRRPGLGWLRFGEFPRLVGLYCSYLLPKHGGGTSQIQVNKTQSTRTWNTL